MNFTRRDALKSIVLGSGVAISSGSLMSLLNIASAQGKDYQWQFLSTQEARTSEALSHIIIPSSKDIPGADKVSIVPFLDLVYAQLVDDDEKAKFKKGIEAFDSAVKSKMNKPFLELSEQARLTFAQALFNLPEDEKNSVLWKIDNNNKNAKKDAEYYLYTFLFNLRRISLEAYIHSELVGEKVLAYDQVPGNYEDKEVDANTRTWSL